MSVGVVPLWTVQDVAAYLGVPVQTLYQWRRKGLGPGGRWVGKYLRYDSVDVHEWFRSRGE